MADNRGRDAESPWAMPVGGWIDVIKRSWREMQDDNLSLIAAGVGFYSFLAMVPLLGAVVLSYGLIADPAAVVQDVQQLSKMLPAEAARLIGEQLMNVVSGAKEKKGIGLLVALAIAFWGATKATGAIVTALNIAYEEDEDRGFIKRTALNLAMVAGAVIVVVLATWEIAVFARLDRWLAGAPSVVLVLGKLLSWVLLTLIGAGGAAMLYRYGPNRDRAKWRWLTPGSAFAALGWALLTVGFGIYAANFGHYNATYGSLGAVVVLLTWLYLSALVLLLGAELNAELEHQTAHDTTRGPARPLGARGAEMADRVAPDEDGSPEPEARPQAPASVSTTSAQALRFPYGLSVSEAALIVGLALFGKRHGPGTAK